MKKIKLLFIGTLPPPYGGVRILVKLLLEDLIESGKVDIKLIDLSTYSKGYKKPFILVFKFIKMLCYLPKVNAITIQTPANYINVFGPLVYFLGKCFNKPLILRRFAGYYDAIYTKMPQLQKYILRKTILNCELSLYETKEQVEFFKKISKNQVKWFPNYRRDNTYPRGQSVDNFKFIYLGQISEEKGINVLLDATQIIDKKEKFTIDLFGQDLFGIKKKIKGNRIVQYKGCISHSKIYAILKKYDSLILPSYREGYPGVIIEAFMSNIPVIASKLPSILEIVIHKEDGLIFNVGDNQALAEAMIELSNNKKLYQRMVKNIQIKKLEFVNTKWTNFFIDELISITKDFA